MTAAAAAKAALYADCQALFAAPILVTYGPTSLYLPMDIISVLDVRSVQVEGPISSQRRREEYLELDGRVSTYVGGGAEAQQTATETAYGYLVSISSYLQDVGVSPSTKATLNGAVRFARMNQHSMHEPDEEEADISLGRFCLIDFTIIARTRI